MVGITFGGSEAALGITLTNLCTIAKTLSLPCMATLMSLYSKRSQNRPFPPTYLYRLSDIRGGNALTDRPSPEARSV